MKNYWLGKAEKIAAVRRIMGGSWPSMEKAIREGRALMSLKGVEQFCESQKQFHVLDGDLVPAKMPLRNKLVSKDKAAQPVDLTIDKLNNLLAEPTEEDETEEHDNGAVRNPDA